MCLHSHLVWGKINVLYDDRDYVDDNYKSDTEIAENTPPYCHKAYVLGGDKMMQ